MIDVCQLAMLHLASASAALLLLGSVGTATVLVPMSDDAIFFSDYNWIRSGGTAMTANPGAFLRVSFTGASLALLVNGTGLSGQSVKLRYSVDDRSMGFLLPNASADAIVLRGAPASGRCCSLQDQVQAERDTRRSSANAKVEEMRVKAEVRLSTPPPRTQKQAQTICWQQLMRRRCALVHSGCSRPRDCLAPPTAHVVTRTALTRAACRVCRRTLRSSMISGKRPWSRPRRRTRMPSRRR